MRVSKGIERLGGEGGDKRPGVSFILRRRFILARRDVMVAAG
jgi:hypothetical protein